MFSVLSVKPAEYFSVLSSHRHQDVFLHFFCVSSFHSRTLLQATLALSLVVSSHKLEIANSISCAVNVPTGKHLFRTTRAQFSSCDVDEALSNQEAVNPVTLPRCILSSCIQLVIANVLVSKCCRRIALSKSFPPISSVW